MSDRHGDQLLGFDGKRAVREHRSAEYLKLPRCPDRSYGAFQ
jgi:hypothetical protein